jgi:drug/metabolite transporter (DMT)-like permease
VRLCTIVHVTRIMNHTTESAPTGRFSDDQINLALYACVVLIWGSSWIGLKLQVNAGVEVMATVAYRFGLGALALFAWAAWRRLNLRLGLAQHVRIALQGALLFCGNYLFFYHAALYMTSGLLAVVFSTVILFNLALGAIFLGQRIERRLAWGAILGLSGVGLVFSPEIGGFSLADKGAVGSLLAVAGTLCAALGMTLAAFNQRSGIPVVQSNAYGMLYGTLVTAVIMLLTGTEFNFAWTLSFVGSLVYLAFVATVLAFGAYLSLLGRIGPTRASYASVLFPVIALAMSTVFENYQWTPVALLGVVLVLAGNVLVLVRPAARRA